MNDIYIDSLKIIKNNDDSYPLMWLSDSNCPCFEDIGLGVGCLKIRGNTQFSIPLCPAVIPLHPNNDPIRKSWVPHSLSPVEPDIPYCSSLSLIRRLWQPNCLQSEYSYKGQNLVQQSFVFDYGAFVRIIPEDTVNGFILKGSSIDSCKLWFDDDVHVIETSPGARPLTYSIKFSMLPDEILIDEKQNINSQNQMKIFDNRINWSFNWYKLNAPLWIEVSIQKSSVLKKTTEKSVNYIKRLSSIKEEWDIFYNENVPDIIVPDERITKLNRYLAYVYRSNEMYLGGLLSHPFTMPKQTFNGFWMWDCCFHTIAGRWYGNRTTVWGNILNIENLQYSKGSDAYGTVTNQAQPYGIDMFLNDDPMSTRTFLMPHLLPDSHGDGSHPPVFSQALEAAWNTDKNMQNLRRLIPNAIAYHDWLERTRKSRNIPGLLIVKRWSDSGMDNSKRWGVKGSGIYNTSFDDIDWSLPSISVDLNVMSVLEKISLANMLEYAGNNSHAAKLRKEAKMRTALIHEVLWNRNLNFYCDIDEQHNRFIPVLAPSGFFPLLLDDLFEDRQNHMLEYMFDCKHFWTNAPLPSISISDPDFRSHHSYWMGCTWMYYNIYILRGLFRRCPDKAWKLLDRILDMLMLNGVPNIFENYNPNTGQGYDAANFGWAGMLVDVFIQEMLGIKTGNLTLNIQDIACPDSWKEWSVKNLFFYNNYYTVSSKRLNGNWSATINLK